MWRLAVLSLVLIMSSRSWAQSCVPGSNCRAPECRCWNDDTAPGGLDTYEIPQMVLVSFQYGLTAANVDMYRALFEGISNPNGCQAKGTFFVQELNTNFELVRQLYDEGHEIGITTTDGLTPRSAKEWKDDFEEMKSKLTQAGIPGNDITGTRAPELYIGGDSQFSAMVANNLTYDSTCVSMDYTTKYNILWPYTYDFVDDTPRCVIGTTPTQPHPGKWQFLVADLEFDGHRCASPSGCSPYLTDSQAAFDLLYDAYAKHYEGTKRAPFILNIDPLWLALGYQNEGTRQFLQFVRAAFDDTWILTNSQALVWIKDPVKADDAPNFQGWSCV